ncbi:MAG TPA: hypothetical protein VGL07_16885 [Buttiauxella sp.]|jgi:hypothetical protein
MSVDNTQTLQQLYESFLEFRDGLMAKAIERSVFSSKGSDGVEFRPVVIIESEDDYRYWQDQFATWKSYANKLKEGRPLIYHDTNRQVHPLPEIVNNITAVTIQLSSATSSKRWTTAGIIKVLLQRRDATLTKLPPEPELVDAYEAEIERFAAYADDYEFMLRRTGYEDTILQLKDNDGQVAKYHVSRFGAFIYNNGNKIVVSEAAARARKSIYDTLEPIPCMAFLSGALYAIPDNEAALKKSKQEAAKAAGVKRMKRKNDEKVASAKAAQSKSNVRTGEEQE